MWSKRSDRLLQQYFRRWTSDYRARREVRAVIDDYLTLIEDTRTEDEVTTDQLSAKDCEDSFECLDVSMVEELSVLDENVENNVSGDENDVRGDEDENEHGDGDENIDQFKSNYLLKKTSNQEKAIVDDHAMISLD
eukprot:CAMPEP_0114428812 /NCGR_PEP_ID=MMETSP0103-20121206/9141_1 /TAXON_ID=37642 ORGANISM="Paraphysomonas imperforata, Strain PA2" /NCGR_SAMPLE_ID=MMETSP0103 /ASSEMBLY_ACC=CAM_ASM_000201 /LENGTH=135 /DNA_ID=CAMNT_0001598085 /DNA_START=1035 /DNA_END=1443 /DNA_ORIENTATION=-